MTTPPKDTLGRDGAERSEPVLFLWKDGETLIVAGPSDDRPARARALYAAPVSLPAREEVARLVAPGAFEEDDPNEKDAKIFRAARAKARETALAKADAILSLIKGDGRE